MPSLAKPPKLSKILGPSFILLGLALGSGELIMWPYLSANHGMGLIWGALLGISFQFFLNLEIMRYSLVWGESVFVGFKRLGFFWPIWFIVSTFIPWALPGFSSASAQILSRIFSWQENIFLPIMILFLTGVILTAGKSLYRTMELLQRTIVMVGLPLIFLLVVVFTNFSDWQDLGLGLIGKGDGWWFFPAGISLASFLGAFAYSGAGGNLNLAQSYYVKEKGLGMGRFGAKITSLLKGGSKKVELEGKTFEPSKTNLARFASWWHLVNLEHFLVFFCLGFVTILFLSILSYTTVFGRSVKEGISFLYQEASMIGAWWSPVIGRLFLAMAALMLYSTQLGVLESSSRIISENLLLLTWKKGKKMNTSLWFYLSLWGQIGLGIVILLLGIKEPRFLLTLSAILNAVAMTILFPLIWCLNKKRLDRKLQPVAWRQIALGIAFLFFLFFSLTTLFSSF